MALSKAQYVAIGQAFTAYVTQKGKGSVEVSEWPLVLGPDLLAAAITGGYFGPRGTVPGFDYGTHTVQGAQVNGTTTGSGIEYVLTVGGVEVARETGDGTFDTEAFANRHGYSLG